MKKITLSSISPKPPKALYVIIILCIILGIVVTPEQLISLGPMRKSLTSDIESVRKIAYAEVLLLRIFFFILALLLTFISIAWKRIINSVLIRAIDNHIPYPLEDYRFSEGFRIFNKSLFIIIGSIIVGVLYIMFGSHLFSPEQFLLINKEDGVMEYSTALLLLICCLLSTILAFKFSGQRGRIVMHGFLAFIFFIMTAEEISWGQRIFNFNTPEIIQSINVQGEFNFHNLFGYFSDHLFILIIFTWGVILPVLAYSSYFYRKLFSWVGLPIASPSLMIGFLIVSMFQRWTIYIFLTQPPNFGIEELRELLSAIALTLLIYESFQLLPNSVIKPCKVS